jgi:AcrR family transcriptional regulator
MVLRRSDALANRARVLEAAAQAFAEQGLSTGIQEIAERAGVGVATIYRGFGSKEELLQATIEVADADISDLLTSAEATTDPSDALRQLVEGMLAHAESYGWLIQALLAGNELERSEASLKSREEHRRRALAIVQRALDAGAVSPAMPADVIKLLIDGAVIALTLRSRRREPHPAPKAIAEGLILLLTGGSDE